MDGHLLLSHLILLLAIGIAGCTTRLPTFSGGFIDGKQEITLHFAEPLSQLPKAAEIEIRDQLNQPVSIEKIAPGSAKNGVTVLLAAPVNLKNEYSATVRGQRIRLIFDKIYTDPAFYQPDVELGAVYTPNATTFRLFAPRATAVKLNLYHQPTLEADEKPASHILAEKSGGIWEVAVAGDLAGKYYTYQIESLAPDCHPELEVVDPYAKLVTRGDGQSLIQKENFYQTIGRGMIVDPRQTGQVAPVANPVFRRSEAIIYETHVRDFTRGAHSGVPDHLKGTFSGAAQRGTRFESYQTGIDHLVELGVNVVQLLPLNEFWVQDEHTFKHRFIDYLDENGNPHPREYYNWGYAPINYFSVDGWYASDLNDLSRLRELKALVSALHTAGIRVTVDVVFNHTFEGSRNNFAHWLFRGIDTDHYYRSFPDGIFCDGIYCGNEVNTEHPMVAKYILDCLKYWVMEFDVDGFRFDWLSALDPVTMSRMIRELRALKPEILLYGELWTLRDRSYSGKNNGTYVDRQHVALFERDYELAPGSLAGFNDYFRDAVKGSGFGRDYTGGYIQNVLAENYYHHPKPHELLKKVIQGMVDFQTLSDDPTEWQGATPLNSINYISCHDGFTLYDKLILAAWCQYQEPGPTAPQPHYPRSATHPQVVDFTDRTQFPDAATESNLQKMDKLGAAILLTSQGIPFVHAGAEFLRQKIKMYPSPDSPTGEMYEFDSNSNTSPDAVNALRWELKAQHFDIFQYYQGLIHLRRAHPTFRRETAESVRTGLKIRDDWTPEAACVGYELVDHQLAGENWKHVIVLINPYPARKIFTIPTGNWQIVVNGEQAGVTLGTCSGGKVEVAGISMLVLHD